MIILYLCCFFSSFDRLHSKWFNYDHGALEKLLNDGPLVQIFSQLLVLVDSQLDFTFWNPDVFPLVCRVAAL